MTFMNWLNCSTYTYVHGSAFGSLIILYGSALNELKYIYTLNFLKVDMKLFMLVG